MPREVEERLQKMEGMIQQLQQSQNQHGQQTDAPRQDSYNAVPPPAGPPRVGGHEQPLHEASLRAQVLPTASHNMTFSSDGRSSAPSKTPSNLLTDYNHLVAGGWEDGTKRDVILLNAQKAFQTLQPPIPDAQWIVYGSREMNCHIHLPVLAPAEAVARYNRIRAQIHEKHPVVPSSSTMIWFTASKPKSVRQRNRRTMGARDKLQNYLLSIGSTNPLVWLGNKRAAAAEPQSLMSDQNAKVIALSTDSEQPGMLFHFNISLISALTGEPAERVEKGLFGAE